MNKELELIRLKEANNFLSKSLVFLTEQDKTIVESIINSNTKLIDSFNQKELTIINPTKKELGSVSSILKKIVISYLTKKSNIVLFEKEFEYSERFNNCRCHETEKNCDECIEEYKEEDDFYRKINKLNKPYWDFVSKITELCSETKISQDLLNAKILLLRKHPKSYLRNKLEVETNEFIKIKMLEQFIEQNKEFVEANITTN